MKRALALVTLAGCVPDLDVDESRVDDPRVLAVQAEPAEAAPNQAVTYRALVVDGAGDVTDAALTWYYCVAPKPLAELGPISRDCLQGASGKLEKLGTGLDADGVLPAETCSLFGPNPPPPVDDQPPGRPVDPDQTGGYKQPVLLGLEGGADDDIVLYEQRIACGLPGVNPATSIAFNQRYHRNVNPSVADVLLERRGQTVTVTGDEVLEVERGETLNVVVRWPACPDNDQCGDGVCGADETTTACAEDCQPAKGCGGQERYVTYDRERRELVVRREALRVAWYANTGRYEDERTGVSADERGRESENRWTAPSARGPAHLWFVVRDERGGVGYRALTLDVR